MIWKPWPARNILGIIEARQIWLNRIFRRDTIEGIFWKLFLGSTCKAQYTCKADELINVPLPISKEKLFSSETGDHAPRPILDQIKEEERNVRITKKNNNHSIFQQTWGAAQKKCVTLAKWHLFFTSFSKKVICDFGQITCFFSMSISYKNKGHKAMEELWIYIYKCT